MNITYIGRQVTVYDDMKQMVEKKLAKFDRYFPRERRRCRHVPEDPRYGMYGDHHLSRFHALPCGGAG